MAATERRLLLLVLTSSETISSAGAVCSGANSMLRAVNGEGGAGHTGGGLLEVVEGRGPRTAEGSEAGSLGSFKNILQKVRQISPNTRLKRLFILCLLYNNYFGEI